jgi:hypothetical protein
MVWRWPRQLGRLRPPGRFDESDAAEDPFDAALAGVSVRNADLGETPLSPLLSEIEASASAVFARHGLPDRLGHYAHSPKVEGWRFLSETLTAEERWSLVNAQREGSGWRFGTLEDLLDQPDRPAPVRQAADLLRLCRRLRGAVASSTSAAPAEDLEAAIRLGAAWRDLKDATSEAGDPPAALANPLPRAAADPAAPLKFTAPAKPRAKRRKPRSKP